MNDRPVPGTSAFGLLGFPAGASTVSGNLRSTMHDARGAAMLVLVATLLSISATPSQAITCTDRQQVCFRYCEKNYTNVARCKATCAQLLDNCMSSGCWESKVTTRQCGITKE